MLHFFKANIDRKGSLAITAKEALNATKGLIFLGAQPKVDSLKISKDQPKS